MRARAGPGVCTRQPNSGDFSSVDRAEENDGEHGGDGGTHAQKRLHTRAETPARGPGSAQRCRCVGEEGGVEPGCRGKEAVVGRKSAPAGTAWRRARDSKSTAALSSPQLQPGACPRAAQRIYIRLGASRRRQRLTGWRKREMHASSGGAVEMHGRKRLQASAKVRDAGRRLRRGDGAGRMAEERWTGDEQVGVSDDN
eukprot:4213586-Pleurochrysis_carterae.AAC.1